VAEYLIDACKAKNIRPSMRLFKDKAIKDFKLYQAGRTEMNWKDLIDSNLAEELISPQYPTTDLSRDEQVEVERRLVREIYLDFSSPEERIVEWKRRTGKSPAAYYRRHQELKKAGKLGGVKTNGKYVRL
jgi:hypothetical protein